MQQPNEEQIANDLIVAGEDPNDPLARALYLEALAATQPIRPQQNGATLISRITAASHLSHGDIGLLIGVSRATVQAYGSGRIPERYDPEELVALKAVLEQQAAAILAVTADIARLQNGALH